MPAAALQALHVWKTHPLIHPPHPHTPSPTYPLTPSLNPLLTIPQTAPHVTQLLLGYLPPDPSEWDEVLARKRTEYFLFCEVGCSWVTRWGFIRSCLGGWGGRTHLAGRQLGASQGVG
jgi:hypothetical protein